jgi:hypothetical protein
LASITKLLQKVPMQGEKLGSEVTFTGGLSLSIGIAIMQPKAKRCFDTINIQTIAVKTG